MRYSLDQALACVMRRGGFEWLPGLAALSTFRQAVDSVPAYRDLLARLCVDVERIASLADFQSRVPILDRDSYLLQYPPDLLCRTGTFSQAYTLERIEGTGRRRGYRVRGALEDARLVTSLGRLLRDQLQVHRRRTLMLIAWSKDAWPAGQRVVRAVEQLVHAKRLRATVVTPGLELDEGLDAARSLVPRFDQTVLVGSASWVRALVECGRQAGLRWERHRIHCLGGGTAATESWRTELAAALGAVSINCRRGRQILRLSTPVAEPTEVTVETPMTAIIRQLAARDDAVARDLFGPVGRDAELFQFDPRRLFAETVDGDLVVTCWATVPLVRYNVHRSGGMLSGSRVRAILHDHGYDLKAMLSARGWRPHLVAPFPLLYASPATDTDDVDPALHPEHNAVATTAEVHTPIIAHARRRAALAVPLVNRSPTEPAAKLPVTIR